MLYDDEFQISPQANILKSNTTEPDYTLSDSALAGNSYGWHKHASTSKMHFHYTATAEDTASTGPMKVVQKNKY